jgi:hypothetical protein
MADRKVADSEALKLLVDAGVIDKKATLEDVLLLSSRLEETSGGDLSTARWAFVVKGKFCLWDNSPAA